MHRQKPLRTSDACLEPCNTCEALTEADADDVSRQDACVACEALAPCAMQVNPPASVLSATNLSIILLLLMATSAATFWLSFQRYTKEQLQEIEDLRLEAEAREVCIPMPYCHSRMLP